MDLRKFSFFLSGVKESRRRREIFQDLALVLKEKPLKIVFLMLKTSKISPAALMITLLLPIPSLKIPFQLSPLALKCLTDTTSFKVPSETKFAMVISKKA